MWGQGTLYITANGAEGSPAIGFGFTTDTWYTLRSVVDGTNVKIYINDQLVKEVEMQGEGADSATDNYVGLWCHTGIVEVGEGFMVEGRMKRVLLYSNYTRQKLLHDTAESKSHALQGRSLCKNNQYNFFMLVGWATTLGQHDLRHFPSWRDVLD